MLGLMFAFIYINGQFWELVVCVSVILRNINQIPLLELSSVREHIEDWSRSAAKTLIFAPQTAQNL